MPRLLLVIAFTYCASGAPCPADDLADKRADYLAAGKMERDHQIGAYKAAAEGCRREIAQWRKQGNPLATQSDRSAKIAKYAVEIKRLEKVPFCRPRLDISRLRTGVIGDLYVDIANTSPQIGNPVKTGVVVQVIDKENVLVECGRGKRQVLWMHADTTDLIDGKAIGFRGPYEVLGTKTYDTAFGTNTVFELVEFDPGPTP